MTTCTHLAPKPESKTKTGLNSMSTYKHLISQLLGVEKVNQSILKTLCMVCPQLKRAWERAGCEDKSFSSRQTWADLYSALVVADTESADKQDASIKVEFNITEYQASRLLFRALLRYNALAYGTILSDWENCPSKAALEVKNELRYYGSNCRDVDLRGNEAKRISALRGKVIQALNSDIKYTTV